MRIRIIISGLLLLLAVHAHAQQVQSRYPNGAVRVQGDLENGLAVGQWITFSQTGDTLEFKHWKSGQLDGPFVEFYQNGTKSRSGAWKMGMEHGYWQSWYPEGHRSMEQNWDAGERNGYFAFYHQQTGNVLESGYYRQGEKDSVWLSFGAAGDSLRFETWKNNVKQGRQCTYSRGVALEVEYLVNQRRHGPYVRYDLYRREAQKGQYVNGQKHGPFVIKSSGVLVREEAYDHGLPHGTWNYYSNGNLIRSEQHDQGKLNGMYRTWHADTYKLSEEGTYVASLRAGKWSYYDRNGRLVGEYVFKANQLHGAYTSYCGAVVEETGFYAAGKKDGKWFGWHCDAATKRYEGAYADNQPDGKWTWWYANQKTEKEGVLEGGLKTGVWRYYSKTGVLVKEEQWENGTLQHVAFPK